MCSIAGFIFIDCDLPSEEVDKRIDWLGGFLVTTSFVFIVFALSQGELASQGWATPCKFLSTLRSKIPGSLTLTSFPDIIVLLILGVIIIGCFLCWEHYLEKIHDDPEAVYSVLTPPPLMKLSIWTRANGRIAAMMVVAFTTYASFQAWDFWMAVRTFFAGISCLRIDILNLHSSTSRTIWPTLQWKPLSFFYPRSYQG